MILTRVAASAFALLVALASVSFGTAARGQQAVGGYTSVAEAYADLTGRLRLGGFAQSDFIVLDDTAHLVTWTFTQASHPAHPAVARREMYQQGGAWYVVTAILCEAARRPCDRLARDFEVLDEQMRQALANGR